MISRRLLLWLLPTFLLTTFPISTKASVPDSVDSTIAQMCPYIEKTPMGVYMQNQESPRQFNRLMLDVLSRVASHAPGLLLAYYQHGIAYNLLVPLAGFALWDVGISVGNYLRPYRVTPDSVTPGILVDFLSSAYQSVYGVAVAASTAAQYQAGLIFPALFAWKYLTRTQTVNTADIAYYRKRIVFRNTLASSLIHKTAEYNGRLRMCSNVKGISNSSVDSLVKLVVDHKQNNVALMTQVYPLMERCQNTEDLDELERKNCQHILKVHGLYEKIRKPNIRSRYMSNHRSRGGIVASFYRPDLKLNIILLRPQTNLTQEIYEDAIFPAKGWRMLEFSEYDDYMSAADIKNNQYQYFVTVAGEKKHYVFLGLEVQQVMDDDGAIVNTLVYLSPFGSVAQYPSMVALPIEFNSREDVLRFSESLIEIFDDDMQRVLLFKIEPSAKDSSSYFDAGSDGGIRRE